MYPHERSLVETLAGKPFAIIGVNSDSDIAIPQKLTKDGTVTWRSFQNSGPEIPISESWQVQGWPTVYIIDAKGVIRYINPQRSSEGLDAIDNAIETLLAEMGHDVDLSQKDDDGEEDGESDEGDSADGQ